MNELTTRPSDAALVTAAFFRGSTLVMMGGGFLLGAYFWSWGLLRMLIWLGTVVAVVLKISGMVRNPRFVAQVAGEGHLGALPSSRVLEALGDSSLQGIYKDAFDRTRALKKALTDDILALPPGPAKVELEAVVPRLEETVTEAQRLARQGQKLELELSKGVKENVEGEIRRLDERIAGESDPTHRRDLEQLRDKKRETVQHLSRSAQALERIRTQLQTVVSTLEESRARTQTLRATLDADSEALPAALTDISADVKYLAEGVEETTKLLTEK